MKYMTAHSIPLNSHVFDQQERATDVLASSHIPVLKSAEWGPTCDFGRFDEPLIYM